MAKNATALISFNILPELIIHVQACIKLKSIKWIIHFASVE